jgi:L-ascorbate metabolism protein UlaG (beta-lactamase superfamily)
MAWLQTRRAPRPIEHAVEGRVLFIGNATMLIRQGPFTILTDPNFLHAGDAARLGYGPTATRLTNPARELEDLPAVDVVLLSHLHEDHFDREVSRRLDTRTLILTTAQGARELRRRGFARAYSMRTWQAFGLDRAGEEVSIRAVPARHGPPLIAAALPETTGFLLEFGGGNPFRMYITGDTLVFDGIREMVARYPEIDLAAMHLGGTKAYGVTMTMDAAQGVEMLSIVQPRAALPIHYDDYDLFASPLEDFLRASREAGFGDCVRPIARGETYVFG